MRTYDKQVALAVRCPVCKRGVGEGCVRRGPRASIMWVPHAERVKAGKLACRAMAVKP